VEKTVIVIGAGVSGLAVTFHLRERLAERGDVQVACLEATGRPGGNIRTDQEDGFTCEWGPNGFLDNEPATLELVRKLGIEDRLLPSNQSAATRFIYRDGRLRKLPTGPLSFLTSNVLSLPGRLRVLCEPLARARKGAGDESVFDFASRRIGREAAATLVDAMVSGIFAGDAGNLSLRSAFPKMWKMENEHGSLFRAMLARRRQAGASGERPAGGPAGPGGTLTSFWTGMQDLVDALARAVGASLRLDTRVTHVADMGVRGFRVYLTEGAPIDAPVVVLACPAWFASEITRSMDEEMAAAMAAIPPAPLAVVHLGYFAGEIGGAPEGFGFLVPRGQGPRMLGCLWSSSIFDGRAGEGRALLTCMIGGAHDPEAIGLTDAQLVETARFDLRTTMGIEAEPRFTRIFRHPRGIPQYTLGHPGRIELIARRLLEHPGMLVCGNSYRGISVNACAAEAPEVAEATLTALERKP
jgi:oxygen-dependent protoporphyrinogen oxidase